MHVPREIRWTVCDVEHAGGELVVVDGVLCARGWRQLPAALQREVSRRYYEVLVYCVQRAERPSEQHLSDTRQWISDGSLETIGAWIACRPGVLVPPGEAAVRAGVWLWQYEAFRGDSHQPVAAVVAHENLQGIHACAVAYWKRQCCHGPRRQDRRQNLYLELCIVVYVRLRPASLCSCALAHVTAMRQARSVSPLR